MRVAVMVAVMLGAVGCSNVKHMSRPTASPDGSGPRRGMVKYFVSGWEGQDTARRTEVLRGVTEACGGPYRIVDESTESVRISAYTTQDWLIVEYECSDGPSQDSAPVAAAGTSGGACYGNGTCNDGLTCRDGACVADAQPAGTTGGECYGNGTCNDGLACHNGWCVTQPVAAPAEPDDDDDDEVGSGRPIAVPMAW